MTAVLCGVVALGLGTTLACLRARRTHARSQPAPRPYAETWR